MTTGRRAEKSGFDSISVYGSILQRDARRRRQITLPF